MWPSLRSNSNTKSESSFFYFIVLFFALIALSACDANEETSGSDGDGTTTDGGGTTAEGDDVPDPTTDGFAATVTQNDNYSVLMSKDGDGETACVAEVGERITCIVDIPERDLFDNGYTLNFSAPQESCDYTGWYPYFYSYFPYGAMPVAVYYQTDSDDLIVTPNGDSVPFFGTDINIGGAECDATRDIVYFFDKSDPTDRHCHTDLFGSLPREAEDMRCPWDYTSLSAFGGGNVDINCCYGNYDQYVLADGETEAETTESNWGEPTNFGACYRGPGMDDSEAKTRFGLPQYITTLVDAAGLTFSYEVEAPTDNFEEQLYAANYFVASDHDAANLTSDVPTLMAVGNPYYQMDCLDHANELKAQIRILVREWNTLEAFESFSSGSSANSNITGSGDPWNVSLNEELNDFCDWKDWEDAFTACAGDSVGYSDFGLEGTYLENEDLIFNPSDYYSPKFEEAP